jgi:protein ImuB
MVHSTPAPVTVVDVDGRPVTVSGRCEVSSAPAALAFSGGPTLAVTGWTGPWPSVEHWWDAELARRHVRFQVATADGRAWLLVLDHGRWQVEGSYS